MAGIFFPIIIFKRHYVQQSYNSTQNIKTSLKQSIQTKFLRTQHLDKNTLKFMFSCNHILRQIKTYQYGSPKFSVCHCKAQSLNTNFYNQASLPEEIFIISEKDKFFNLSTLQYCKNKIIILQNSNSSNEMQILAYFVCYWLYQNQQHQHVLVIC